MKKLLCLIAMLACTGAHAWKPEGNVTMVLPGGAGSGVDVLAKLIMPAMQRGGVKVTVQYLPGAGGVVAANTFKAYPADGSAVMISGLGQFVHANVAFPEAVAYTVNDFDLVTSVAFSSFGITAAANSDATLRTLIKGAAHSGGWTIGAAGVNPIMTSEHLLHVLGAHGISRTVPYKQGAQVITDTMGGHISFSFNQLNNVGPLHKAGKVKIIAITDRKRSTLLPNVPAVSERVAGFVSFSQWGVVLPKGAPEPVAAYYLRLLSDALTRPDMQAIYRDSFMRISRDELGPQKFRQTVSNAQREWLPRGEYYKRRG